MARDLELQELIEKARAAGWEITEYEESKAYSAKTPDGHTWIFRNTAAFDTPMLSPEALKEILKGITDGA